MGIRTKYGILADLFLITAMTFLILYLGISPALAETTHSVSAKLDLTGHWIGFVSIGIFAVAYIMVMLEEVTRLRKSKPVILAAGLIWSVIAWKYVNNGMPHVAEQAVRHSILEFAELFLFLLVAMTYVNAMSERNVFEWLRSWLVSRAYNFKTLFWLTGLLAFFISPVADNLTTALLMCAVIMAVGVGDSRFISLGCINIVVAANAGGVFSPFGDITTLMVWQKGIIDFSGFFVLFIPSLVNWLVPAVIMSFAIPDTYPTAAGEYIEMKSGAVVIIILFLATIVTAVSVHNFLHMPPMLGMMIGLTYLQFYGFYLRKQALANVPRGLWDDSAIGSPVAFDIFKMVARAEWDTLLFFFGVVLAVGGLGTIGYMELLSSVMYAELGATFSNILIGILSAVVDNIPVMFAVLTMNPGAEVGMNHAQWLLVTMTAGVGGSMLSIGSAAGVALMGQARGHYTFFSHLKWSWAIALGYAASIFIHIALNGS